MKPLKSNFLIYSLISFVILLSSKISTCEDAGTYEIYIENKMTTQDLFIIFYPVGSVFNCAYNTSEPTQYTFDISVGQGSNIRRRENQEPFLRYIVGLDGYALDGRSGAPTGFFKLWKSGTSGGLNNAYDNKCYLASDATPNDPGNVGCEDGVGIKLRDRRNKC